MGVVIVVIVIMLRLPLVVGVDIDMLPLLEMLLYDESNVMLAVSRVS
jgi:hypothetical protein